MNREDFLKIESREQQQEFLQKLSYPVQMKTSENEYHLYLPQLGIIASSSDICVAQKELESKKESYFAKMLEAGAASEIVFPESEVNIFDNRRSLIKMTTKYSSIFLFCVITAFATAKVFVKTLDKGIDKVSAKVEKVFNVSEDKKAKRLIRFKENVKSVKPYVDELKKLL